MLVIVAAAGMLVATDTASAGGDPARGAAVFRKCQSCHSVEDGANRVGPSLFHILGRPAASLPDFNYSEAMKAYGATGHIWDEATLTSYLQAPRDVVEGTRMMFPGVRAPEDIADLIAYLKDPAAVKQGW